MGSGQDQQQRQQHDRGHAGCAGPSAGNSDPRDERSDDRAGDEQGASNPEESLMLGSDSFADVDFSLAVDRPDDRAAWEPGGIPVTCHEPIEPGLGNQGWTSRADGTNFG